MLQFFKRPLGAEMSTYPPASKNSQILLKSKRIFICGCTLR